MKKILFFSSVISLFLYGCAGSGNGELIGDINRAPWNPTDPYGMVFIPQGSFMMGPSEQDVPFANVSTNQRASVGAFYMDETEITNNEYRQFEKWVVDSIIRTELKLFQTQGRGDQADTLYSKYVVNGDTLAKLDWNIRIDKDSFQSYYDKIFVKARVDGDVVKEEDNFVYRYEMLDIRKLSQRNKEDEEYIDGLSGEDFRDDFVRDTVIKMYPSTMDFQSDYVYSNNETDAIFRYEHEAYDDYPVVGITWDQANAFCHWRTHIMNEFLRARKEPLMPDFRLPTETEWEYAARGGLGMSPYPWGGPYTRNEKGCFLANFKPLRGNYTADGGLKAIKVRSYNPNNYGLYDMAGNVAEWTSTVYEEMSNSYTHDMNSDNSRSTQQMSGKEDEFKRKVIRGGSWKDISYFIRNSTRSYEYADASTSYIGFRCVMDFLGRDKKDFQ